MSPRWKTRNVAGSSSGIDERSTSSPRTSLIVARHSLKTVSVLRPRKSIFSRPIGSTKWPSYCVFISDSPSVGMIGSESMSGSREMRMPQAWTPGWRTDPWSFSEMERMRRTMGGPEFFASTSSLEPL